jgi:ComF family protein
MKVDQSGHLARVLGQALANHFTTQLAALDVDGIVPLPMSTRRRLLRGTNPPAILAREIGRSLTKPVWSGLLSRSHTQPQQGLSHPGRKRNVKGTMRLSKNYRLDAPHLLLIDDVLTTGASCSEAARVLKRGGATQVTVLVLARTPEH